MISPIIAFSAITGKPTKEKIFTRLKALKDNGIDSVLVYPRSGCELEYLSDEWFDTVEYYITLSEQLGLKVWLYDDFNWPSCDAKGKVSSVPEYRLKSICISGERTGDISTRSFHNASLFGEKFFPDILSYDAVDYFISITHEKYYERFSEYFGSVIEGFFTDEPSAGYCATENSIPYYDGMDEDYLKTCGRNFLDDLKNGYENFYNIAFSLIGKRAKSCFFDRITSWCESHGIKSTGHIIYEELPFNGTKNYGDVLGVLSALSIPGVDEIDTNLASKSILFLYSVAQAAAGENGAMAELFALGPCDMTYAKKKCMMYLASCFKVCRFFIISHLDMRGNAIIKDYFNNASPDQPDFCGMKILSETAKIAAEYSKKEFDAELYVAYPQDICVRDYKTPIEDDFYFELINRLAKHQIQFKLIPFETAEKNDNTLYFTQDRKYQIGGKLYATVDEVCALFNKKCRVTSLNGGLCDGIFVREYSDGSIVVVNHFGKADEYLIDGKKVFLDEFGVYTAEEDDTLCYAKRQDAEGDFSLLHDNSNVIRAMFVNEQTNSQINCKDDIKVIFAVRKGETASLDGIPLCLGSENNELLSVGMKDLYLTTDSIKLEKGSHLLSSANDIRYLPSVLLLGDFSAKPVSGEVCILELDKRNKVYKTGQKFTDFGTVEFSRELLILSDAKAIEIKGTALYTKLYVNDVLLGEKIASPYIYPIGDGVKGKRVTLKVVQYSNMGNMFSDVEYFRDASKTAQWKGAPVPKPTTFGFDKISFVF